MSRKNPRPIKIDKKKLMSLCEGLYEEMLETFYTKFYGTDLEDVPLMKISSTPILLASSILEDVPMIGTKKKTFVKVQVYSARDKASHGGVVFGGEYGVVNEGYGILSIVINSRFSPLSIGNLANSSETVFKQMYSALIHEYTHARQFRKGQSENTSNVFKEKGYKAYLNISEEIGAHLQQIVDEVLAKNPSQVKSYFQSKPVDKALVMLSPIYRRIRPELSEKNDMYILKAIIQAIKEEGIVLKRKTRKNPKKSSITPEDRFKRWHWGKDSTHEIDINDDRFPKNMIGIGRLMELRFDRPEIRSNPSGSIVENPMSIEIDEDSINDCYVVFDHDHPKDRIYIILNPSSKKDLKLVYKDLDDKPILLNDLAINIGGWHGDMQDYPEVKVKPLGYLSDLAYYTHKVGDDDGIGSGYIHKMGEEKGGVEPIIAVSSDGNLWIVGGSYYCPYAGITN